MCWGDNALGQLGNGSSAPSSVPVAVGGLWTQAGASLGISSISVGAGHACALTSQGMMECWGGNSSGQLLNGDTANSAVATAAVGLAAPVVAIAAGETHVCILTAAGAVECGGFNNYGQNGGSANPLMTPVAGLGSGIVSIVAGYYHSCALNSVGGVLCWGYNADGELGNGALTNSATPVQVSGLASGVVSIGAVTSSFSTCAATTVNTLYCWGDNTRDELGNGGGGGGTIAVAQSTPTLALLSSQAPITTVGGGEFVNCFVQSGGLSCWGYFNEIFNNRQAAQASPVVMPGLSTGILTAQSGFADLCALTMSGSVLCEGNQSLWSAAGGAYVTTPVVVPGLASGVESLSVGYQFILPATQLPPAREISPPKERPAPSLSPDLPTALPIPSL